jgi:small-conductance mechanosensitive channel
MTFRQHITLLLLILITIPSQAVMKEDSLASTLAILRNELTVYHNDYSARQVIMKQTSQRVFTQLMQTMQRSNQNALMLYSQNDGYVFDLTYACHEAIEQYREFKAHLIPFRTFVEKSDNEVERMDSLINSLKSLPVMILDEKGKTDRNVCLALAVNTRRMLVEDRDQLNEYITYYKMTENRLQYLNDYANKKYSEIQSSIFTNGSNNYLVILSRLRSYLSETKETIGRKYTFYNNVRSQWDSRWIVGVFMVILFYGFISILLNQLLVRWLATRLIKRGAFSSFAESFMAKRTMIILASTAVTFAILLGIVQALSTQNFLIMASSLLVQFAWLLSVIILSIMLRAKPEQSIKTLSLYMPLLVNGFIVISFRVVLIPNALVNLIFPPILLICCIWQWHVTRKIGDNVARSDKGYAAFSQIIFIVSLVCSAIGYTLLSVQILIWWIMQLTCILTITCLRDWYKEYAKKKKLDELPITQTWLQNAIYLIVLPVAAIASVVFSIYWAADVFNLSDITLDLFKYNFLNHPNFKASIFAITQVTALYCVFNYLNKIAKAFAKHFLEQQDPSNAAQRFMMVKNVLQILIWGIWFLISLAIFDISSTWLVVISGGLSTGIGFASKDILENIYYGISLMTGRIKVGDMIQVDGTMGKVTSISYVSTVVESVYGEIITFQNSQLFAKNYKNLTKNNGYILAVIPFGVAYGSNLKQVTELVEDAVNNLHHEWMDPEKKVKSVMSGMNDSSVDFKLFVWADAVKKSYVISDVLMCIYNTLNENGIEIPFPQRDITIKNLSEIKA